MPAGNSAMFPSGAIFVNFVLDFTVSCSVYNNKLTIIYNYYLNVIALGTCSTIIIVIQCS